MSEVPLQGELPIASVGVVADAHPGSVEIQTGRMDNSNTPARKA